MIKDLRRLFATGLAAVTVATSAPFVAPAVSRADTPSRAAAPPPGKIAALPLAHPIRGLRVQGTSAT